MKEKIKILVPLIFIVGVVSCGRNPNDIRLNRETYDETIKTATLFEEAVAPLVLKQLDADYPNDMVFKIPNQGTVTAKTNLNFTSDKIFIYCHQEAPKGNDDPDISIDLKDVNQVSSSETTISWDLNANYLKIDDHKTAVSYILLDTQSNEYWYCVSPLDGSAKYRKLISSDILSECKTFSNFVFYVTTYELTYKLPNIPVQNLAEEYFRAGFDISGFIGVRNFKYNNIISGLNILSPMSLLTYPISKTAEYTVTVSTALDLMRIFLEPFGISHNFKASMDEAQNAYCEEIGLGDLSLSDFKDFYDSDSIQLILTYLLSQGYTVKLDKSDGTINLDFFLNYKNNFIHQEEFIANLKDINFDLLLDYTHITPELDNLDPIVDPNFTFQSDIKKTNLDFTANQEMVETSTVDQVNLSDFPISE